MHLMTLPPHILSMLHVQDVHISMLARSILELSDSWFMLILRKYDFRFQPPPTPRLGPPPPSLPPDFPIAKLALSLITNAKRLLSWLLFKCNHIFAKVNYLRHRPQWNEIKLKSDCSSMQATGRRTKPSSLAVQGPWSVEWVISNSTLSLPAKLTSSSVSGLSSGSASDASASTTAKNTVQTSTRDTFFLSER